MDVFQKGLPHQGEFPQLLEDAGLAVGWAVLVHKGDVEVHLMAHHDVEQLNVGPLRAVQLLGESKIKK